MCLGMVRLAEGIVARSQPRLGLMGIRVGRKAFGGDVDSVEAPLVVKGIGGPPVRGIVIRAPLVEEVGSGVEVLARFEDKIVMVRQGNLLASSFHPELTDDLRVHQYFLEIAKSQSERR